MKSTTLHEIRADLNLDLSTALLAGLAGHGIPRFGTSAAREALRTRAMWTRVCTPSCRCPTRWPSCRTYGAPRESNSVPASPWPLAAGCDDTPWLAGEPPTA
jgi:hypothetical protein